MLYVILSILNPGGHRNRTLPPRVTFAGPVRTLDLARGSSSASPSLSSLSSTGSRGRDLRRRFMNMGTSASAAVAAAWRKLPNDDRFTRITGSGLHIFL